MTEVTAVRTIEVVTGEIKALVSHSLDCAIEIGRRLIEAKEMLPHGQWGTWLENEVDFSQRTANNMMKLFEEYGSPQSALFGAEVNSQTYAKLSVSKALALLAVPSEEREEFAQEVDADKLSTRELEEAIRQRDEAIDAQRRAEEQAGEEKKRADSALVSANDKIAEAKKVQQEASERAKKLAAELKELKSKPIDVAVQQPSDEDMAAAVEKATAEAKAEHDKKVAELEKKLKAAEEEKAETISQLGTAKAELEQERKREAMSDPVTTEFKVVFEDVQAKLGRLIMLAGQAGENGDKLKAAVKAVLDKFGEAVA